MDLDFLIDEYGFKEVTEEEGVLYIKNSLKEKKGVLGVIIVAKYDPSTLYYTINHDVIEYDNTITKVEILKAKAENEQQLRELLALAY